MPLFKRPAKGSCNLVGLDIGTHSCKLVELKKKGSVCEVVGWAVEPIGQGSPKDAVKKVLQKATSSAASPSTAVSGKGTLIRYMEMPKMKEQDFRKSFSLEIDRYFPFPKDQIFTDCCILDPTTKDNKMLVLLAAAKKEVVQDRMKLLDELGIEVECVGFNATALANIFSELGGDDVSAPPPAPAPPPAAVPAPPAPSPARESGAPAAVAVLDIGQVVSNITIISKRLPRFTRDIFIGGQDITRSVSTGLSVGIGEAEELKTNPEGRAEEVLKASEAAIVNLASELRLSFDYFVTENNIPIGKLFLTGGGSLLQGLPVFLSNHLETPTEIWNPFQLLTLGPEIKADAIQAEAARLSVALGLALYD